MRTELLQAIYTRDTSFLEGYLQTVPMDALVDDLQQLISGVQLNAHLIDFTKAAMQGLCVSAGAEIMAHGGLTQKQEEAIAFVAAGIAQATLSELQKQQP